MSRRVVPTCWVALCALVACAGCATSPGVVRREATDRASPDAVATTPAAPRGRRTGASTPAPTSRSAADATMWRRLEAHLVAWEDARGSAYPEQADEHAARLRGEVDAHRAMLGDAVEGRFGKAEQALATSVLGFASDTEATAVLVRVLTNRDPRIAGNALIALGIRRDPTTPLGPILAYCDRTRPTEVRRYAPLALANVLDARAARGETPDLIAKRDALTRLATLIEDHDAVVRLHTVKALGALDAVGATNHLVATLDDPHLRVRYAAAAALERSGDPAGFERVVALLAKSPVDAQPMIADILMSYAERIQGSPLAPEFREKLGTHPRPWIHWFDDWKRTGVAAAR